MEEHFIRLIWSVKITPIFLFKQIFYQYVL